jgi:hypothetical protein
MTRIVRKQSRIGRWPVLAYALVVIVFIAARAIGLISTTDLVTGVSVVLAVFPGIYLAAVQIRETQAENDRIRTAELRRALEVEAFKTVTSAIVKLTESLANLGSIYGIAFVTLRSPAPSDSTLRDLKNHMPRVLALYRAKTDFVFAVEAYEIALLPYHHLRIYIQHRLDDLIATITAFGRSIPFDMEQSKIDPELQRIIKTASTISADFHALQSYLLDYRIEIMNGLLGDLFERVVPRRKPLMAHYKTLVEVATPKLVDAENQRRIIDAVTGWPLGEDAA